MPFTKQQTKWLLAGIATGALVAVVPACAQNDNPKPAGKMEITLELKDGNKTRTMDPGHVFAQGDLVRFRFRPTFDGFLYVTDLSSSNKSALLFPKDETGKDNHILGGLGYVIPASGGGWFRVEGPAGFETVYFLVAPTDLGTVPGYVPLPAAPEPSPAPVILTPRCDDEIFKARGDCIDLSAGPKTIAPGDTLPAGFANLPDTTSRDLIVIRNGKSVVVSAASALKGPAIYTFRLAHN